jgi:cell division protein FtsQ
MRQLMPNLSKKKPEPRVEPLVERREPGLGAPWAAEPIAHEFAPKLRAPAFVDDDAEDDAPETPALRSPRIAAAPAQQAAKPQRMKAPKRAPQAAAKRMPHRTARRSVLWRKRLATAGLAAAISAGLTLAAFMIVSDRPAQAWRATRAEVLDWTAQSGLAVVDIQAVGRKHTSGEDILAALGVSQRTPILGLDLVDAKRRIESLPWVASAEVERRLPHALRIVITERTPVAILQTADRSVLIDAQGVQIVQVAAQSAGLPIVTGRGAAENVAELLAELTAFPELGSRVKAAVRVGDRRWDVKLDSVETGIEVRLPETEAAAAWGRLAELDRKHRLLARDVALIDLRLPDRMVVRLVDGKTLPAANYGTVAKGGHSA